MRFFFLIIIVVIEVTGQTIAPIETVPIDLSPFSKSSGKKIIIQDSSNLFKELNTARRMNTVGISLFCSGITLQLIGIPLTFSTNDKLGVTGMVLSLNGVGMEYVAPVVSGVGAEKTWKTVSVQNPAFIKHEGWNHYKKGYAFLAIQIVSILSGTLLAITVEDPVVASFAGGSAIASGIIFDLARHISFGRSVGASNRYTRKVYYEIRGK